VCSRGRDARFDRQRTGRACGERELAAKVERYLQQYLSFHAFSGVVHLARGDETVFFSPLDWGNSRFLSGATEPSNGASRCPDRRHSW
jgi:hypothetical protein